MFITIHKLTGHLKVMGLILVLGSEKFLRTVA